ncbi:MAG: hypothetical protein QOC96_1234 [Acidobacteriota bacterium]|nr:hypothetical protein [Acidobacteriota bacterium]
MRKLPLTLVLCAFFVLFSNAAASACLCRIQSLAHIKKTASVIFVGQALEVENGFKTGQFRGWRTTFKVSRYWKGQLSDEMIVYTGPDDCAAYFEVGQEYLVFAYTPKGEQQLYTDACMKTGLVRHSAEDLKALGKGKFLHAANK